VNGTTKRNPIATIRHVLADGSVIEESEEPFPVEHQHELMPHAALMGGKKPADTSLNTSEEMNGTGDESEEEGGKESEGSYTSASLRSARKRRRMAELGAKGE
jgi:hypothetical protein